MDEQNLPCLVLQYNKEHKIIGMEITTTYNYWEKEAFVSMNDKQLFPVSHDKIRYTNFAQWSLSIEMIPIVGKVYKTFKDIESTIFYPGY